MCVNVNYITREKFQLDPTKNENFSHSSHYKIRPLLQRYVYRHDVKKVGDFLIGVCGENVCLLSDPAEILFLVILKTLTHSMNVSDRKYK